MVYNNKGEFKLEFKICPQNTDGYLIAQSSLKFDGCLVDLLNECLTSDYGHRRCCEERENYDENMLVESDD
jgi:hypothetical protein